MTLPTSNTASNDDASNCRLNNQAATSDTRRSENESLLLSSPIQPNTASSSTPSIQSTRTNTTDFLSIMDQHQQPYHHSNPIPVDPRNDMNIMKGIPSSSSTATGSPRRCYSRNPGQLSNLHSIIDEALSISDWLLLSDTDDDDYDRLLLP